jgi:hypothetical protein
LALTVATLKQPHAFAMTDGTLEIQGGTDKRSHRSERAIELLGWPDPWRPVALHQHKTLARSRRTGAKDDRTTVRQCQAGLEIQLQTLVAALGVEGPSTSRTGPQQDGLDVTIVITQRQRTDVVLHDQQAITETAQR